VESVSDYFKQNLPRREEILVLTFVLAQRSAHAPWSRLNSNTCYPWDLFVGVAHGDILQYLFSQVLGEGKPLPPDDAQFATKTLLPLILNFVKTG